ncbi:MAG: class I SAM-dependent methyltransferase [Gammaproteobacteria bacterium]|nr:class I SAM-dependent methyltransferase [Gammaproteobacteria bacterium]
MNVFEQLYQTRGFASQRRYPNEQLIGFIAGNYFKADAATRSQIKVLELGCGSGANLWFVAREGFDVTGIDFAPSGIALCQTMLDIWQVEAKLQIADMTALPFENESFQVIFDVVSMQHLTLVQHAAALHEAYRCLQAGGQYFSYHLAENSFIRQEVTEMVDECTVVDIPAGLPLAGNGQTCLLSTEVYQQLLIAAGFSDISIEKQTRTYNGQSQTLEYLIVTARK